VYRCWPSEYQALPDLDAGTNAVAIKGIKPENKCRARDLLLTERVQTENRIKNCPGNPQSHMHDESFWLA